jgi:hypothetical protein
MIIQSSAIQMNAAHFKSEEHTQMDMFRTFGAGNRMQVMNFLPDQTESQDEDRVSISKDAQTFLEDIQEKVKDAKQAKEEEEQGAMDLKTYMVQQIVEAVLGQEVKVVKSSDIDSETPTFSEAIAEASMEAPQGEPATEYIHHESHYEQESLAFNAQGKVITADGQEIAFDLQLNMSREYYSESTIAMREGGRPIDPLVINFSGAVANLTSQKFSFDLDADGTNDEISFVAPGSGFLVFDKNKDNIVQDGSELFGPTTGNGFSELAQYDDDQNGWIDENDTIYDYLAVWTKNHAGKDSLLSLKEADVGAIYLAAAETSFDYKDMALNTHGRLNQSGVYLSESGQARLIQQLDLVA